MKAYFHLGRFMSYSNYCSRGTEFSEVMIQGDSGCRWCRVVCAGLIMKNVSSQYYKLLYKLIKEWNTCIIQWLFTDHDVAWNFHVFGITRMWGNGHWSVNIHLSTLIMPRKPASENVCLCHLLNILANFQTYFCIQANSVDPDQTAPRGAVWSGSTLFAKMTFKITSRWQSRRQLLWLVVQGLIQIWSPYITYLA